MRLPGSEPGGGGGGVFGGHAERRRAGFWAERPAGEALAQRITIRFALRGFDRDTTRLYLAHRLRLAGLDRPLFTAPALQALFDASQGVMRRIDALAHQALAAATLGRAKLVEPEHVVQAAEELRP